MEVEKYWNPVLETMPGEQLEKLQLKKFKRAMKYAIDNAPFYRKKYEAGGIIPDDIKTLADVRKVPLVDKDEFKLTQQGKEPPPKWNFWAPWIKNYAGETQIGYFETWGQEYIWIDQDLKKSMGY